MPKNPNYKKIIFELWKTKKKGVELAKEYNVSTSYISQIKKKTEQLKYPIKIIDNNIVCYKCGENREDLVFHHNHHTGEMIALICQLCNLKLGSKEIDFDGIDIYNNEDELKIYVILNKEEISQFLKIKSSLGIRSNPDIFRHLIKNYFSNHLPETRTKSSVINQKAINKYSKEEWIQTIEQQIDRMKDKFEVGNNAAKMLWEMCLEINESFVASGDNYKNDIRNFLIKNLPISNEMRTFDKIITESDTLIEDESIGDQILLSEPEIQKKDQIQKTPPIIKEKIYIPGEIKTMIYDYQQNKSEILKSKLHDYIEENYPAIIEISSSIDDAINLLEEELK